ncbi:AraC family transcriptional regulator [Sinimarinibacterium sp. CAU 1509]|uniref:AraC family transcriptional regulator n=1 Tax=Sinimarinibacterium sp. CAU 1509 TaxID=2562283 RepID=UPI0010ACD36A|nr:AraC family transcriptional regulator [Sinimarinibacterium sp. CAU 1509]TJY64679.1 AraC family transcriptional regulator [Sinimarinibacterium sp. CAU 1509]
MEKDSVSINFVREALHGALRQGIDVAPLLQRARIPERLLESSQARVSAESFATLWLEVAAALDDEFFGLDARRMKVGSFSSLCYFMIGTRSLRSATQRAIRLLRIVLDDLEVELREDGGRAAIVLLPSPRSRAQGRTVPAFAYETLLIMVHGLMCWAAGRRIRITQARFSYPMPEHWREYTLMYSQALQFDQAETAIEFEAAHLDAPVVQDEASAREFLREAPYTIVLKYKDADSWSAKVRAQLEDAAPQDWPTFEELALQIGVSASMLRRGLDREGSSFRAMKDAMRRDMAIEHLTHTDQPIPAIAHALGFAEPSAFHRAFKQWTGVRPGEYRRQNALG